VPCLAHCACPLVAISCICLAQMMASSFSWSRNRFYNTTYKHAFTYKDLWGRSLAFSQVFPLSDQILIFLGHCLPDLRHRHWVFSAKGSWPQPNTSRHSIRNSLPMSTHIYCFSHKSFMCLIWNLCYCFYQSSGEVVGDGGWRCVSTRSKTKFRA